MPVVDEDDLHKDMSLVEYMLADPMLIDVDTPFPKLVQLFRQMHLRHLMVIDSDHMLVGIITRKDIFAYTDFFLANTVLKNAMHEAERF